MIDIIPAIDMKDHKVVRLSQGRMDAATIYDADPLGMAGKWIEKGAKRIHLVDLNGAFEGKPIHFSEVTAMAKAFPDVAFEIGGGIRSADTVKAYLDAGVDYCILGTVAIKNSELLIELAHQFEGRLILGVDAKNGMVATEGWDDVSEVSALALLEKFSHIQLNAVIYTDIAKDGMMKGLNLESTKELAKKSPFPIIASGGLTRLEEIDQLKSMDNVCGVIAGKSLYENLFTLEEAIKKAGEHAQ